ncbi:MAG: hypothetical protein ACE5HA_09020, partial [Anaerolineae bacterium]
MMVTNLSDEHRRMLLSSSSISHDVVLARGYVKIEDKAVLRELGFSRAQARAPGLLLPLWTTDGQNGPYVYRPDNPRVVENRRKG